MMMMMMMMPHANCNSKVEQVVEVVEEADDALNMKMSSGKRSKMCSFLKLIKTTRLVGHRVATPVGNVATPERSYVRRSRTQTIKSSPSLFCGVRTRMLPQQS